MTPNQVAARLDRLPLSRFHGRFLFWVSLGAWFDYYDNFIAGTLASVLPQAGVLKNPQPGGMFSELGLFMAALPLGMFVGTILLGLATDYLGRRFGFIAMLLLYSLATLAGGAGYYPLTAAAGATTGLVLLLVTRFLAGAGIGAENVILDAYISELMPRQVRGWAVTIAHAAAFTAMPVAAFLPLLLVPKEAPQRWWTLLVLGSLGALFTWYFRRRLPESPRWLAATGRGEEAARIVKDIEETVAREKQQPLTTVDVAPRPELPRVPFRAIWSRQYRGRTLLLTAFQLLQTVGYYGFTHWLVLLLQKKDFTPESARGMQSISFLLAPLGPLLALWTIERFQRKWLIVGLSVSLAAGQVLFGTLQEAVVLTLLGMLIVVGNNWFSAVFHAYQAELFPTEARATGIGFTYAWSRASMVALNLFMPDLLETSLPAVFGMMTAAFLGVAGLIGCFGPRTNAQPLEEIAV